MIPVTNKLRVYHIAQIPCKPFIVEVKDEAEAKKIIDVLANQHLFLLELNIIPDYCNAVGVEMWDEQMEEDENGEKWTDYWNGDELMEWDEFEETYLN